MKYKQNIPLIYDSEVRIVYFNLMRAIKLFIQLIDLVKLQFSIEFENQINKHMETQQFYQYFTQCSDHLSSSAIFSWRIVLENWQPIQNLYKSSKTNSNTNMQQPKLLHKKSAFLLKTYQILENTSYEDIIAWHYDGIGFVINNVDKFTESVLPVYFKHSNFASFIRQLNMYGFSKKRSSKSQNYYFHPKFQKNQKEMIREIQRKIQKKTHKNIPYSRQHEQTEQIRIPTQISIQLEYKPEPITPKSNPTELYQKQTQNKYQSLINLNNSLINVQLNSILQILQQLKHFNINLENKQQIQTILTEYIETQYQFHNTLQQKLTQKQNEADSQKYKQNQEYKDEVQDKSIGMLETEQILKDKRDGSR